MIAAWSDSESSESESDEQHTANICLVAKEVQNNKETEYENLDEVDVSELYKYSKEKIIDTLISFANIKQKYLSKYKDQKKNVLELRQKNLVLEKLNNRNKTIEDKNLELQVKCDNNQKIILKFTQGQENLHKVLCTQKASFNKEGIGYNHLNRNKCYKNFFVNPNFYKKKNETRNYCSKVDRTTYSCTFRKRDLKVIQIWVPKGTKPPNMVARDFESRFNDKSRTRV